MVVFVVGACFATGSAAQDRVLFRFDQADAAVAWQTVKDGVMGGRSESRFRINQDRNLEFFGTLSLENNGGFASVRACGDNLRLNDDDVIAVGVRGDGRQYGLNVHEGPNSGDNSCRQTFNTKRDEWIEVEFPVARFAGTWRGSVLPNEKPEPHRIRGPGFLLGDKKPGPFRLEVEWIEARREANQDSDVPPKDGS